MTEQEKNIIKNEIIDAIAAQSKTIEDLAPASAVTDSDLIELNGGRKAAFSVLKKYFGIPTLPSLDGYLTKTIADGLYQPKGSYAAAGHSHAFSALDGLPTTLAGYGITDASIGNDGTITLGGKSIKPITRHQSIYSLTFKAGVFSAMSYDPTGAAASVNIPTSTDHIDEGANLYFTDARAVAALKTTTDALSAGIDKKLDKSLFDGLFTPYSGNTALTWAQVIAGSSYDSVKLNAGLWTESFLTAKGKGSGTSGSGSFDPSVLDGYAQKTWVQGQGYVTSATLAAYLTKAKADTLYQPLGDYAAANHSHSQYALASALSDYALASSLTAHTSDAAAHVSAQDRARWNKTSTDLAAILGSDSDTIINKWEEVVNFLDTYTEADTLAGLLGNKVDKVAGYGLSKNDFNDALLAKLNGIAAGANKYVHPVHTAYTIAAATGRVLSAISVDALGHVTSVASKALTAADIPALAISKVTGLQDALDAKAQKKDFEDFVAKFDSMFRLVNTGTDAAPKYAIEALYGVYTYEFLTAKGRGGTPSQGGTFDPSVLDGYAEKAWVQQQGYVTSATLSAYLTKTKADTLYQPVGNYALASHSHSQYALASSLNDHIADTVKHITATERAAWNNKVDKVAGKGLSENDFTDALLSKLNGIAAGANNYVLPKATADVLGGVRIGANISLDAATGKISTHAPYVHPSHTIRNIAAAAGLVLASVSVNALGHVTNITSKQLAAADIPALAISKITGLQGVLDAKAAKADLEALRSLLYGMFTPYDGNTPLTWAQVIAGDSYDSLKANGGLWTESFMSAKGKGMLSGGSGSGSFDPSVLDGYAQKTWVQGQGYITAPTLQSYLAKYLPYAPLNGGLSAVSSVTTWGVGTGTTVAEWDAGGSSIKLKKDCPAASKMSLLIDGTVYVNEGQDAVATQSWANGRYSLLGHTHSQYLTAHQSLSHLLRIDGSNGTAAGVSVLVNKLTEGTSTPTDNDYYVAQYAGGGTTTTTYHRRPHSALWSYIKNKADGVYQPKGSYLTSHQALDYINVKDVRGETRLPSYFGDYKLSSWFNNTGTPTSAWYSGIHVKGWCGYASWELAATSTTNVNDKNLYFRVGINSTWETWQKVLTDTNYSSILGSVYQAKGDYVTLSGSQTITGRKVFGAAPLFNHFATSQNHAAFVINKSGTNYFGMGGNGSADVIQMAMCSNVGDWKLDDTSLTLKVIGAVQANSIARIGGTASQFLKADGSVDGNSYALSSSLANYYTKTEADGRYMRYFWTSVPGYDCSTCNDKSLVSFTYNNNAPFCGGFIDVSTNGYGFYLGTGYNGDYSLYYRRHGIASDGGMGAWQRLARVTDTVANANALGGVALERFVYGDNATGTHDLGTALSDTARKSGFYRANSDDNASLFIHCSHSTNTYAFQIGTVYTDSSLKFRHLINNTWSSWRTLLDTTNYASTLDSRYYTETEINTKLSAYLTTSSAASTYAKLASPNNLVHSVNEITMIPSGFSNDLWLNHKTTGGTNGAVNAYYMGNGAAGVADVVAKGFVKMGSSDSYLLLGGGGHKAVSDFLLRSGGTMTNTNVVTNLNADLLDGHHKRDFNGSARYGTTAQPTSGYYKIKIKSTAAWMLGFKILAYQNYCFDEIDISGYNYGAYYWYQAAASLVCSHGNNPKASIGVTFGYDSAWNLWVAIPAAYYAGITVTDVTNGYNQVADYHSLFEIVYESSLTGTVQTTVTASRHAMLTDNVASATKLATPRAINGTSFDGTADITTSRWGATRTLWGRSCNGSANIAGDMTGVGHITMSGYIYSDKTGTARSVLDYHGDGSLALNYGLANAGLPCTIYGNVGIGKVPTYKLDVDGAARVSGLAIATGGVQIGSTDDYGWYISSSRIAAGLGTARGVNVGNLLVSNMWADYTKVPTNGAYIKGVTKIGTDTASYALNAASFICDSWVRSKGATGWYNETYGGGWYMTDGTYIRNYNYKSLYLSGTGTKDLLHIKNGGITIDAYGGGAWNFGSGRINLPIPSDSGQSSLIVAYRSGTTDWIGDTLNRLFAMELLDSGTQMGFCFEGETKFRMYSNGEFYATAAMYTPGFITAKKSGGSSDERLKKNIKERRLSIETILNAPCVGFDWKDGGGKGVGTLAQYWLHRLPEVVLTDPDGYYAVDYGALAHMEVSSLAKCLAPKVEKNEDEIKRLERRVAALEKENSRLKARAGGKKNKESSTL